MGSSSPVLGYSNGKLASSDYRNKIPQNGELKQQTLSYNSEAESLRSRSHNSWVLETASHLPSLSCDLTWHTDNTSSLCLLEGHQLHHRLCLLHYI